MRISVWGEGRLGGVRGGICARFLCAYSVSFVIASALLKSRRHTIESYYGLVFRLGLHIAYTLEQKSPL